MNQPKETNKQKDLVIFFLTESKKEKGKKMCVFYAYANATNNGLGDKRTKEEAGEGEGEGKRIYVYALHWMRFGV